MYISIVIPIFNEEATIKKNLYKVYNFFKDKKNFEIIVINDGSNDRSLEVLNNLQISNLIILNNKNNIGKGASIRKGVKISLGELLLVTDADLSAPIEEFNKLIKFYNKGYEVIIGSSSTKDANLIIKQGIIRIISGKVFNKLANLILNLNYKDTQCGFKLFKNDILKKIMKLSIIDRFAIDAEILFIAKKLKCKTYEKGINWKDNSNSSVKLISDSLNMFIDLVKIRINNYKDNS